MTANAHAGRPGAPRGRAGRARVPHVRKGLLWTHLSVGIAAGLLMTLTGATGSLLVFGDEIDRLLNPALLRVLPGPQRVPMDEVIDGVRAAFPDRRLDRIHLAYDPGRSLELCVAGGVEPLCVYANPHSGALLGVRVPAHSFKGRLFSFHRRLLAGPAGETIVGIEGALLIVLLLTGLILWTYARRPVRPWRSSADSTPLVRRLDWHRTLGLWSMPLLLLIAVTGTAMIFRPTFEGTWNRLASTPMPGPPTVPAAAGGALPSVDRALRTVMAAMPDATPTFVIFPASPAAPLAIRARMPGEWLPKGRSFVYLEPNRGAILRADNALASPLGYRLGNGLYPLHVGLLGGTATRLLHCLVGLAPAALSWTGTFMAWRRLFPARAAAARQRSPDGSCPSVV